MGATGNGKTRTGQSRGADDTLIRVTGLRTSFGRQVVHERAAFDDEAAVAVVAGLWWQRPLARLVPVTDGSEMAEVVAPRVWGRRRGLPVRRLITVDVNPQELGRRKPWMRFGHDDDRAERTARRRWHGQAVDQPTRGK